MRLTTMSKLYSAAVYWTIPLVAVQPKGDLFTSLQFPSSSLLLGKHLVHVGYWKEKNHLLVIGLPAER